MKKFKATTNSKHKLPIADNLLEQNFASNRPGEVWVADITYIATDGGWLYLAGIKDLFNGEIVGYAMSERMTKELVGKTLFSAVKAKRPSEGLIHHSDRGSQYCSHDYQRLLKQFGIRSSMSRKGNCYDNAPNGKFLGNFEKRAAPSSTLPDLAGSDSGNKREYIEIFYNR